MPPKRIAPFRYARIFLNEFITLLDYALCSGFSNLFNFRIAQRITQINEEIDRSKKNCQLYIVTNTIPGEDSLGRNRAVQKTPKAQTHDGDDWNKSISESMTHYN